MSPSQILTSALAALLAASVLVNIGLGRAWLAARDDAATAIGQRDTARADASACSDATDDLRTLADQRKAEANKARTQAMATAAGRNAHADAILTAPPAVSGDDCKSAQVRVHEWLKNREQP